MFGPTNPNSHGILARVDILYLWKTAQLKDKSHLLPECSK